MRKLFIIFFCSFFLMQFSAVANAENEIVDKYVPNAKIVGEHRFNYLFWKVYDATLYAPNGIYLANKPFALQLDYLRWLKSVLIAERALHEIKQQGYNNSQKLSVWLDKMTKIFPNVNDGDTILGIQNEKGHAVFYFNNEYIDTIEDEMFSQKFFDIWLSEKTSEPKMRKQLLGM